MSTHVDLYYGVNGFLNWVVGFSDSAMQWQKQLNLIFNIRPMWPSHPYLSCNENMWSGSHNVKIRFVRPHVTYAMESTGSVWMCCLPPAFSRGWSQCCWPVVLWDSEMLWVLITLVWQLIQQPHTDKSSRYWVQLNHSMDISDGQHRLSVELIIGLPLVARCETALPDRQIPYCTVITGNSVVQDMAVSSLSCLQLLCNSFDWSLGKYNIEWSCVCYLQFALIF